MEMMISDYFLFAVAILWLVIASASDLKKREVANWLSFSMLAIALGIRAISSIIFLNNAYLIWGIVYVLIFFGLANLLYYTKIFAGGDAKLLIALGALFATTPSFTSFVNPLNLHFPAIFLLNSLIIASLYGIIFSIGISLRNWKNFKKSFKEIYHNTKKVRLPILILILACIIFLFAIKYYSMLFFIALVFLFPYLYIFVKAVENSCMIRFVKPKDLTIGDWLNKSIKIGRKIIRPSADGLSNKDIILFKKYNKKVEIKYGIPFVPVFLITIILSVICGNLFYIIVEFLIKFL